VKTFLFSFLSLLARHQTHPRTQPQQSRSPAFMRGPSVQSPSGALDLSSLFAHHPLFRSPAGKTAQRGPSRRPPPAAADRWGAPVIFLLQRPHRTRVRAAPSIPSRVPRASFSSGPHAKKELPRPIKGSRCPASSFSPETLAPKLSCAALSREP
jgi:hypothetical protein